MSNPPTPPESHQDKLVARIRELEAESQKDRFLREALGERLKFEELLSEISSVYANLPAAEVDKTIEHGLQRIGEFLGAERCNLAQYSSAGTVRLVHSWGRPEVGPLPDFQPDASSYFPWTVATLRSGRLVCFSDPSELPAEAAVDRENYRRFSTDSHLSVPIAVGGNVMGSLSIGASGRHSWPEGLPPRLRLLGEIFANAVMRKEHELEVQNAFSEIRRLKDQLEADYGYLREEIDLEHNSHHMIGQSESFKRMIFKIQQVALTDITILVQGETGTGKELIARAVHDASQRKDRPMVKVNCAALPASLLESELFGHEKGAFTSAQARQVGRFELAHGSTIFLDEIGELPLESQAKLLRVLQEGEFERLGSSRTIQVDVRVIAATNRDLEAEVLRGRFRQDLWFRLNVFPITAPPLRQRGEDIPLLASWLVDKFSRKFGRNIQRIPAGVLKALQDYHWPGNIRELENILERATLTTQGPSLQLLDQLTPIAPPDQENPPLPTLEQSERELIIRALEETHGRVHGPRGAALLLGLNPSTLRSRMRKLGIRIKSSVD